MIGTGRAIAIVGTNRHVSKRWIANAILNRHPRCLKVGGSVVSLSFMFPHLTEHEKQIVQSIDLCYLQKCVMAVIIVSCRLNRLLEGP